MAENPLAFPKPGDDWNADSTGMTLRDYFATQAMVGTLINRDAYGVLVRKAAGKPAEADRLVALTAYQIADAMLKARTTT